MANLSEQEAKLVASMQADMVTAKNALRDIAVASRELMQINYKAGRAVEGNAAMRLHGAVTKVRGELIMAHADASDALANAYDDGGPVVLGGGGGR